MRSWIAVEHLIGMDEENDRWEEEEIIIQNKSKNKLKMVGMRALVIAVVQTVWVELGVRFGLWRLTEDDRLQDKVHIL